MNPSHLRVSAIDAAPSVTFLRLGRGGGRSWFSSSSRPHAGFQQSAAVAAITGMHDPVHRPGEAWSASMHVWHLVDVLRIGTERLLTLTPRPGRGITCWDENALAEARRYQQLSPTVGVMMLRPAAHAWVTAAAAPGDVQVRHPQFGALGAVEIIRRNAHEVHHLMDINRAAARR